MFQEEKIFANGLKRKSLVYREIYASNVKEELTVTIKDYLEGAHATDTIRGFCFEVQKLSKPYLRKK